MEGPTVSQLGGCCTTGSLSPFWGHRPFCKAHEGSGSPPQKDRCDTIHRAAWLVCEPYAWHNLSPLSSFPKDFLESWIKPHLLQEVCHDDTVPPPFGHQVALVVKNPSANVGDKRCGLDSWLGKIPWRRAWQPTPVFLPGESHGQRSLAGYSP